MATTIVVPDLKFAGAYYPEILDGLIRYIRLNVPEITDEDELELFIQLARCYALTGHYNNVLIDAAANEAFPSTALLLESVRSHLSLIDYYPSGATPATAEILLELTKVFTETTLIVPEKSQFATERTEVEDEILFEVLTSAGVSTERTDQVSWVLAYDDSASAFTDYTASARSASGSAFQPWGSPIQVGDALYVAHNDVLWDQINVYLDTAAGSGIYGVWEYYDGEFSDTNPSYVTNLGATLRVGLDSFLGSKRADGASVRVRLGSTGAYEDLTSLYSVTYGNYVETTTLLGQTTPSTTVTDYIVGAEWNVLSDFVDGTLDTGATEGKHLMQSGAVTYTLPFSLTERWAQTAVDGKTAYWLRFRVVYVDGTPSLPSIEQVRIDQGGQYLVVEATQGESVSDDPLGSSTGLAGQTFKLKQKPYIPTTIKVEIGPSGSREEWAEQPDLVSSGTQDKHYVLDLDAEDQGTVRFGDGTNGRVPPVGTDNIAASYRIGADADGNVGADTITVNKSGIAFVRNITNPQAATGWAEKEGGTDQALALLKREGPASLRALGRAAVAEDFETLAKAWVTAVGASPVGRAFAIEEAFGAKTVEVVVVASGGGFLTSAQISELEEYFNGDETVTPPVRGKGMINTQTTVTNYTRRTIDVTAIVYGKGVDQTAVQNAIRALLDPEALKADGVTYEWDFGGKVSDSKIIAAIHGADVRVSDVDLTLPSGDVFLDVRELPYLGTLSLTFTEA